MPGTAATRRVRGLPSGFPAEIDADSHIRFVDDMIWNMSDYSVRLLKTFGGIDNFTGNNVKIEWIEDDLWSRRFLAAEAMDDSETGLDMPANTAFRYPPGTVLKHDSELYRVTAIAGVSELTVVRGFAGTTPASHLISTVVQVVGNTFHEDDAWVKRPTSILAFKHNFFQVFQTAIEVTYRRSESAMYGLRGGDLSFQVAKALKEMMVALEGSVVAGWRDPGVDADEPAMMGGLEFYITSANGAQVTDLSAAALSEADLLDELQDLYETVGLENMGKLVICDMWAKRKIASFHSPEMRLKQGENRAGLVVDQLETDFGMIDIMVHESVPFSNLYVVNPDYIDVGHHGKLGRFHTVEVPVSGPYAQTAIYGDYSCRVRNPQSMARIHNYSQTA